MPFSTALAFAVPLYAISKPRGGSVQPFSICNWHVMAIRHVQVKQSPCSLKSSYTMNASCMEGETQKFSGVLLFVC